MQKMESNTLLEIINHTLEVIKSEPSMAKQFLEGSLLFEQDKCYVRFYSLSVFEVAVETKEGELIKKIYNNGKALLPERDNPDQRWDATDIAAILHLRSEMDLYLHEEGLTDHKKYTREGMADRVLKEREAKSLKEEFRIVWADNIHGDHWVYNKKGGKYRVFLRDFDSETGYSDSPDARTNKLGTTKHIMAAFHQLKNDKSLFRRLDKKIPFVEVYLNPLNEYRVSWEYPDELPEDIDALVNAFFQGKNWLDDRELKDFLSFIDQAQTHEMIVIRPEVIEKVDKAYEEEMLDWVKKNHEIPYEKINAELYPYQQKGVESITFKKGMILADEMGLGKTLQAIAASVAKKNIFGFKKTLIVCPASLKEQWKKEIERFTTEQASIVQGSPKLRAEQYLHDEAFFLIVNYELVLRDTLAINKAGIDFLILDEAQRAKNFETKTAGSIKRIDKKHCLILTGTPIENRLSDLYSLMQLIDDNFLGPLWEFSYQHCLFDHENTNKINGYYNLEALKKKLKPVLLRREKRKVIKELPNINQMDVVVELGSLQGEYHAGYASGLQKIIRKKFLTPADHTRIHQLLSSMRMVCNSTYLVDNETNESPKLDELKQILIEKLDVINTDCKIIIFSEWIKTHKLIGELLRKYDLRYIEFNGKTPVAKRGKLIETFEKDPDCKFFLSTESGGAGLNLQVADTLINFELPWNPAKKNQRIGRIDRLGQQSGHLTVINLITKDSIEMRIASGLMLKQNLFDGVLNDTANRDTVDFSEKGRSQFLQELEEMAAQLQATNQPVEMQIAEEEELAIIEDTIVENIEPSQPAAHEPDMATEQKKVEQTEQLEAVLSQGMSFFSGLYKMATGSEMDAQEEQIKVDQETGEVTMKFKLPGFGG